MLRKMITYITYPVLIAGIVLCLFGVAYAATNIDSTNKWAWGTNVGWIHFNPSHSQVTIDPATGSFDGYAWAENVGWIHFKGSTYNVVTTYRPAAPEMDVQRPAGTSIADGGTDDVGNQTVGTVNLTYTIDNTAGTAQLEVTAVTASSLVNSSGFALGTALPLNVAAGGTATLDVSFNVDAAGAFSLDMDIADNDADENPYDITISGTGTALDTDSDDVPDVSDNCPTVANADQANSDGDTHGDACDNCPNNDNEDQADGDGDEVGDVCEWTCYGLHNDDPTVCSGNGSCDAPDTCVCEAGWEGENCEFPAPPVSGTAVSVNGLELPWWVVLVTLAVLAVLGVALLRRRRA